MRDIETYLRTQTTKFFHMGIQGEISPTSLAIANQSHDWIIYTEFFQKLIHILHILHANDTLSGLDFNDPVYAINLITFDFCFFIFYMCAIPQNKVFFRYILVVDHTVKSELFCIFLIERYLM